MITNKKLDTVADLLRLRAREQPDQTAYTFLPDGEGDAVSLTYAGLHRLAETVAAGVISTCEPGQRALLLYPSGLEFIAAFFGCLYAGVVAVPAYPPRRNQKLKRLKAIIDDCQPGLVLTTSKIMRLTEPMFMQTPGLEDLPWIATDSLPAPAGSHEAVAIRPEMLAFLQYTSGSTGQPKGVMISHDNLLHNQEVQAEAFGFNQDDRVVGWLPLFHDMGLIGLMLHPLYVGIPAVLMSPATFLKKPVRWLQAISDYRATASVAPNFAFDVCTRDITDAQMQTLDLSRWHFVLSGAEPVRADTLDRFSEKFAACGFRKTAIRPAYGLAEATLMVTCSGADGEPVTRNVDPQSLAQNRFHAVADGEKSAQVFVSNGRVRHDLQLVIADPDSKRICQPGDIGEIWVRGRSVAQGYWNKPAVSDDIFRAHLVDSGDGPYLRTGDLGCLHDNELYVTGRHKDLIIIAGKNHYPQDIEWTVDDLCVADETGQSSLQAGAAAAFAVEHEGREALVIAVEVTRAYQRDMTRLEKAGRGTGDAALPAPEALISDIRAAVARSHELQVQDVLLLKAGGLPRTSSGKVQRHRCRQGYQVGDLDVLWSASTTAAEAAPPQIQEAETPTAVEGRHGAADIREWIRERCADLLGLEAEQIDVHTELASYGLNSIVAMQLVGELETWLDCKVPQDIVWEQPDIASIADALTGLTDRQPALASQLPAVAHQPAELHQPFPLNQIQEAYWLGRSDAFEMGNVACHFYAEYDSEELDIVRLATAWRGLIQRHDMFRAVVTRDGRQKILPQVPEYDIAVTDLRPMDPAGQHDYLEKFRARLSHKVPDPETWPLFELCAHRLSDRRYRLHLSFDLLIADVASFMLIFREWSELYADPGAQLTGLDLSYRDYILAEQSVQASEDYQRSLKYWSERVADLPPGPELPLAKNPATITKPHFSRRSGGLDRREWMLLKQRAQQYGITPSMLLCAAYAEVLAGWSKEARFTLNLTLFNRLPVHPQVNDIVGDFTSVLLLEVDHGVEAGFAARAERMQKQLRRDLEHRIVNGVEVLRMKSRCQGNCNMPTMPVVFTSSLGVKEMQGVEAVDDGWLGKKVFAVSQTPQVWLDSQVAEENGALIYAWDAVDELFPAGLLDDMFSAYQQLLDALTQDAAVWQQPALCLTPAEQLQQWQAANATEGPVPAGLLHEAFAARVEQCWDRAAIITSQQTLSYRELQQRATQVAHYLHGQAVKPDDLVAVVMDKGWEQAVAALGIMQAGGAYVPIDAALPVDRIINLLELSEAHVVLNQSWVDGALKWPEHLQRLSVDTLPPATDTLLPLAPVQQADNLAYVIFTSGSTGRPKGVMIDHRGALNTVVDINQRFAVDEKDCVLGVSCFSFDLSVYDLFGLLLAGGTLVLPDADKVNDPAHLLGMINRHQVTIWNSAPAFMGGFLEYTAAHPEQIPVSLRLALFSGDWIPLHVPLQLKRMIPDIQVISLGGATEASIWSIYYPIDEVDENWRSIPYGKALRNQTFHVYDSRLQPRPAWVTGPLYIGGIGVARGYWRDEEKTAASFIKHPVTGETLYRTGDLGRYMPDGNIEFLGREDFQVKVQGFRIELGEIETVQNHHPAVMDSVVAAWDDGQGQKQLASYVIPVLEPERVSVRIPCFAEDHTGASDLLRVIEISREGFRLAGCPDHWNEDERLCLHLQLPGTHQKQTLHGMVVWQHEHMAGIRLRMSDEIGRQLADAINHVISEQGDGEVIRRFYYRDGDGRRLEYRIPGHEPCRLRFGSRYIEMDVLNLSCGGMAVRGMPEELNPGDPVSLQVALPTQEAMLTISGKIRRVYGDQAGIMFASSSAQYAALKDAVVHVVKRDGYWLCEHRVSVIRDYLADRLPAYMVPRHYILLQDFPLTCNGKVDRKALPAPEHRAEQSAIPRNALESELVAIWAEVLGVANLGIRDNFFELGGYSQLAVRLLLRIREQLQVDLPIRALFESPTIEALAESISHLQSPARARGAKRENLHREALYGEYARRGIASRIGIIRADKNYIRATGLNLTHRQQGRDVTVLDMVGGYGSTLLGHNHPELVKTAQQLLEQGMPFHAQHTNNVEAGELGRALSDRIGAYTGREYIATLASTGTEAIEAAIKHAKMELRDKAEQQQRNEDNLAALLLYQAKQQRLQFDDAVYAEAEKLLGVELRRDPEALLEAIKIHNGRQYEQAPLFIALAHSFHGMTSGSLSLTASDDFRRPFHWMGIRSAWIAHDKQALQAKIDQETATLLALDVDQRGRVTVQTRDWLAIAGLFVEPVQGEGGIYRVDRQFAADARALADQHGFPVIIDEIQCGMGRTGTFCAAEQLGLRGDYYTFSKSLGGGLSKVSALMVDSARYLDDFGYYHGSTFAEDKPACQLALAALQIIERDNLVDECARSGALFVEKLTRLQEQYPGQVAEVRGYGLMIGIELASLDQSASFLFRALSSDGMEILNHLIAGYLLNQLGIRIAPTKTRNTIRFLPSAYISEHEMDRVISALERVFRIIQYANPGRLLRYIVDDFDEQEVIRDWRAEQPAWRNDVPGDEPRVAHIGHLEDSASLLLAEPSLAEVPEARREALLEKLFPLARPAVGQQLRITSETGETVHLSIIGLPLTGRLFENMMRDEKQRQQLVEKIEESMQLAKQSGCRIVGFGGYTSIVTLNCTTVATTELALTSGNAYTTALGIQGVQKCAQQQGIDLARAQVAIVGAKGNIGSIFTRLLAEECESCILIGRDAGDEGLLEVACALYRDALDRIRKGDDIQGLAKSVARTRAVKEVLEGRVPEDGSGEYLYREIQAELGPRAPVKISADLGDLGDCEIVVSATSSAEPVIFPEHLSARSRVICDIATPPDVSEQVYRQRPDVEVLSGGLALLPGEPGVQLLGTRLPENHVYGCVAETTLLGLANMSDSFSFGEMNKDQVRLIAQLAEQHGYRLGKPKYSVHAGDNGRSGEAAGSGVAYDDGDELTNTEVIARVLGHTEDDNLPMSGTIAHLPGSDME